MYNYNVGYFDMKCNRNTTLRHAKQMSYMELREKAIEAANTVIEENEYWQAILKLGHSICISEVYPFVIDVLVRDHGFKALEYEQCIDEYDWVVCPKE